MKALQERRCTRKRSSNWNSDHLLIAQKIQKLLKDHKEKFRPPGQTGTFGNMAFGAAAAQIAAHHTRDRKELLSQGEVLRRHRELAAEYGNQADRVVAQARQDGQQRMKEVKAQAQSAVTWARDHVFERSAVQDGRAILETALVRSMGETTTPAFNRSSSAGSTQENSKNFRRSAHADNTRRELWQGWSARFTSPEARFWLINSLEIKRV
jgi:hypothetical protein